jgi:hypothetical protein
MAKRRPPAEPRGERRRQSAAELLGHASSAGAEEALATLVNQFADPLSFLRELVQNSLDAASTRIEVGFGSEAPDLSDAVLACISVADNGEGMNELVIDRYLLTLFASSKEDDLTKIGKFGIGFVSIFAIKPDLVVLETGQAGEAWRIIFHPDARHEKLRLADPVEGTVVRLYKRMDRAGLEELRARGRETVRYWCKYAEAEILFDGEPIHEEFTLEAGLTVRLSEPGTEILVGFAPPPRRAPAEGEGAAPPQAPPPPARIVGFYNRGLTLIEGAALPEPQDFLDGLSFRIKSRYLEHTLTRDNVLVDESYAKALALLRRLVEGELRSALYAELERLARAQAVEEREHEQAFAWAALPSMRLAAHGADRRVFAVVEGEPVSLRQLRQLRSPTGGVLAAAAANPVTALLARGGVPALAGGAAARYLQTVENLTVLEVDALYATALPVAEDATQAAWLARVARLLDRCGLKVRGVRLGALRYPGSRSAGSLHLRQTEPFALTRIGHDDRPTTLGGARELVLAHDHPLVVRCLELAAREPALAAHLLAQGVSLLEGGPARAPALAERALESEAGDA